MTTIKVHTPAQIEYACILRNDEKPHPAAMDIIARLEAQRDGLHKQYAEQAVQLHLLKRKCKTLEGVLEDAPPAILREHFRLHAPPLPERYWHDARKRGEEFYEGDDIREYTFNVVSSWERQWRDAYAYAMTVAGMEGDAANVGKPAKDMEP